jgi:hypothetical protein
MPFSILSAKFITSVVSLNPVSYFARSQATVVHSSSSESCPSSCSRPTFGSPMIMTTTTVVNSGRHWNLWLVDCYHGCLLHTLDHDLCLPHRALSLILNVRQAAHDWVLTTRLSTALGGARWSGWLIAGTVAPLPRPLFSPPKSLTDLERPASAP